MNIKSKNWLIIAPIAVVVLGMIGFVSEGCSFYEALLSSLKLLKVDLDPLPANPLIEIARWLGVFFLFGLVYSAILVVFENSITWTKSRRKDSVAIHGDGVYAEQLKNSLGKRGLLTDNRFSFRAPKQVIIYENDENSLEFFQTHSKKLSNAEEVHLCLELGSHVSVDQKNVIIVNLSEVRAISFWREHFCTSSENVVIIGSGQLAEAVVYWGLLVNVFSEENKINYKVYGDFDRFYAVHKNITKMVSSFGGDSIDFINQQWYSDIGCISNADRVIICGSTRDNIEVATTLCDVGINATIYLFSENANVSSLIDSSKCILAGMVSDDNISDAVLMDDIHTAGKLCHATYMLSEKDGSIDLLDNKGVSDYILGNEFKIGYEKTVICEGQEKVCNIGGWNDTDAFTRGSNYATAIHDVQKYRLLLLHGVDVKGMNEKENRKTFDQLSGSVKDQLQNIEHIRWCRYHFLNNWGVLEEEFIVDGERKAKDPKRKLHRDLVPYEELPESEKEKDAYFYQTLALRL